MSAEGVSRSVLNNTLKALEGAALVLREYYQEIPDSYNSHKGDKVWARYCQIELAAKDLRLSLSTGSVEVIDDVPAEAVQ